MTVYLWTLVCLPEVNEEIEIDGIKQGTKVDNNSLAHPKIPCVQRESEREVFYKLRVP